MIKLLLIWLSAYARAIEEEMWYYGEPGNDVVGSFFQRRIPKLMPFYSGHVSLMQCLLGERCPWWLAYNPALPLPISPLTDDFWHWVKKLEVLATSCLLAIVSGSWYWIPLYNYLWGVLWFMSYHFFLPRKGMGAWKPLWKLLAFWRKRD